MTRQERILDFWFEFGSTYSYPAAMRIERLAAAHDIRLSWKAFLLGPIFKSQGWVDSPFNLYPAKGRYMWRDLERCCAAEGIPFRRPSRFPRSGLLAARIACWFADAHWLPNFTRAVFQANFATDQEISEPQVLSTCLESINQDSSRILAIASSDEAKAKLRAQTEQAARLGIFGAPIFIASREMFWGNDRLGQAIEFCAMPR